MSPGVVELTVKSELLLAYKYATRQVTQLVLVVVFFWTILTLKLFEVPINLGFLNPCKVKSINPFGLTI